MMRKAATFRAAFAAALALTLVCYSRSAADTTAVQDIAVVVNPNNAVNNLSLSGLGKIYRGERQYWRANLPVVVLFRTPGTYEREVVLRTIFQMTEQQYRQYWVSKIMRAEATSPPAELFSSGMIKEGVAAIPGAIGCVRLSDVRPDMKVLRIDGRLPSEPGYPLH
jgi:ABC-type phosphate transport system substrate-binding protein